MVITLLLKIETEQVGTFRPGAPLDLGTLGFEPCEPHCFHTTACHWVLKNLTKMVNNYKIDKNSSLTCSITSGAIQQGVPTKVCRTFSRELSFPAASQALTPKSAIITLPSSPSRMLPALISLKKWIHKHPLTKFYSVQQSKQHREKIMLRSRGQTLYR